MIKPTVIIGLLSLAIAFNAHAQDSERIDRLEKELREMNLRLQKLESSPQRPSNTQEPLSSADGWKSIPNWRKLNTQMGESDVRKLLGEPQRVEGGSFATWNYQNRGYVIFHEGRVYRWSEPDPRFQIIPPR